MRASAKSAVFALHAVSPLFSDGDSNDQLVALATKREYGHSPDQAALACVLVLWIIAAIGGSHALALHVMTFATRHYG
jgi:hypothetical protein